MVLHLKYALTILALVCFLPFAALAETAPDEPAHARYIKGSDLMQKNEYEGAVYWLTLAAEQEYAPAWRDLALLYKAGAGVAQNDDKARELLSLAAAQNDVEAIYYLGFMYFDAPEPDYNEVKSLWCKAAELGFEPAAYNLGSFYYHGYGGAPDYMQAIAWFQQAHELGSITAAHDLALVYMHGVNGVNNYDLGLSWLEKAVDRGNAGTKYIMGLLYFNGEGVERDYTKARTYFEETAAFEYPDGMYGLGLLCAQGLGGEVDHARARECYESAAAQGNVLAQLELGNIYYSGTGLEQKDLSRAYQWFSLAAEAGQEEARARVAAMERELEYSEMGQGQIALARAYVFGMGGEQNLVKAYSRLLIAREYDQNVDEMLSTLRGLTDAERALGEQMARDWLEADAKRRP